MYSVGAWTAFLTNGLGLRYCAIVRPLDLVKEMLSGGFRFRQAERPLDSPRLCSDEVIIFIARLTGLVVKRDWLVSPKVTLSSVHRIK
jgi:hypothetical protein